MKNILIPIILMLMTIWRLDAAVENRPAVISGYIQENQTTFSESIIYVRSATNYNREGYLVFEITDAVAVNSAMLRLYVSDMQNNDPTTVDFSAVEGNVVDGMTWENRPTSLTTLGSKDVAADDEYVDIDITSYYNSLVDAGGATHLTVKVTSSTTNAFVQFNSSTSGVVEARPYLAVDSECPGFSIDYDTIACVGTNPVLAGEARTESGIYRDSLTTKCGADSVIVYDLLIIEDETVTETVSICAGESYNGYSESGTYTDEISTSDGACTQTTELVLTVNDLPAVDLGDDFTINEDESKTLDAGSGFSSYLWSDGTTGQTVDVSIESFNSGDQIIVEVTDENGCVGSDTVVVTITENAVKPVRDGYVREFDDMWYDNTALEVKYDQYGDLDNPGNAPFYSREAYLAFDISELEQPITNVRLKLYVYNVTWVDATPNDPIPVVVSIAEGLYEDSIKWTGRPNANLYKSAGSLELGDSHVETFVEFDINEVFQSNIAGKTDQFSIKITSYDDENSSMIKFRSVDHTTEAFQPRLKYSFAEEDTTGNVLSSIDPEVEIMIFPNPATETIFIRKGVLNAEKVIRNLAGQVVLSTRENEIDVSALRSGIYVLSIAAEGKIISKRFIKN